MAEKRKRTTGRPEGPAGGQGRSASELRLRRLADPDAWELLHPRCAQDRQDDLEEVRKMADAGETEIAVDELRWLLGGCSDCLEAHRMLGELALESDDLKLARGHFG